MPEGKVVIVGDGAIGKTFLLTSLLQEPGKTNDWGSSDSYVPTAATNMAANWTHTDEDGNIQDYEMEIWDTAGQEALRSLRNMSYPDTDIFLIGYDMTRKMTLENIVSHPLNELASYELPDADKDDSDNGGLVVGGWISELVAGCESDSHIILVGTKADYWDELKNSGTDKEKEQLTTWQEGYDVARAIKAKAYIQTSAKTYQGILENMPGELEGGPADKQVDPEGVWLKNKICELRAKSIANKDIQVVEKVEAKQPEPTKPHVEPPKQTTPQQQEATNTTSQKTDSAKPTSDETTPPVKPPKEPKEGGCCTLL